MTIIFGLISLSVLVVVHEIGHFLAARMCGITVENFSIGMGPVLLHKTVHGIDYRLSLIPFGGYCGLKGEKDFQAALDEKRDYFTKDPSSMYGSHPLKRLIIAAAGPFFNALFAALAFTIIALAGYTYYSADNRIILADEIYPDVTSYARAQGFRTGDRILSLNGSPIQTFADISRYISARPDEDITAVVERGGERIELELRPAFEKSAGAGKIGVVNWIDPVIAAVPERGEAELSGLRKGDTITAVNGTPVFSAAEVFKYLSADAGGNSENARQVELTYRRGEDAHDERTALIKISGGEQLFSFEMPKHRSRAYSFFPALAYGITETLDTAGLTIKSIGFLFRGADVTNAVSGPVRITVMLGDAVKTGFGAGTRQGLASVLSLLALISVSLFIMNLLPVPILDGGIVFFSLVQIVLRKPLKPKFLYHIQFIGIAFIGALIVLALFGDARYLFFNRK
ncbi:MAG: RIP metalloprotease RseP [Treponemataceae bacterium]|nr:MAG: RIP metalloprotease RseP [Treponemataceae bacterium]